MKLPFCFSLLLFGAMAALAQHGPELAPGVHAKTSATPLREMSGIVKSRRRDNVYWVHNDSGDSPRLFAITDDGKMILPTYSRFSYYGEKNAGEASQKGKRSWQGFEVLYASNVDWEDIAIDSSYLYLGDIGNNGNARRDLAIYLVSEIDPTASTRTAVIRKLPFVYPDQQEFPPAKPHYDSESLFVDGGKVYLITKHRDGGLLGSWEPGATLYRLDTDFTDRNNLLTLVDSHPAITAATAAELSPDGQTLAVLSYTRLWLFNRPASGDEWLSAPARSYPLDTRVFRQTEGLTWDDDATLRITNEQGNIFRIPLEAGLDR